MNDQELQNKAQEKVKKAGRKIVPPIPPLSSDEILNTLADIIIERILEEKKISKIPINP